MSSFDAGKGGGGAGLFQPDAAVSFIVVPLVAVVIMFSPSLHPTNPPLPRL